MIDNITNEAVQSACKKRISKLKVERRFYQIIQEKYKLQSMMETTEVESVRVACRERLKQLIKELEALEMEDEEDVDDNEINKKSHDDEKLVHKSTISCADNDGVDGDVGAGGEEQKEDSQWYQRVLKYVNGAVEPSLKEDETKPVALVKRSLVAPLLDGTMGHDGILEKKDECYPEIQRRHEPHSLDQQRLPQQNRQSRSLIAPLLDCTIGHDNTLEKTGEYYPTEHRHQKQYYSQGHQQPPQQNGQNIAEGSYPMNHNNQDGNSQRHHSRTSCNDLDALTPHRYTAISTPTSGHYSMGYNGNQRAPLSPRTTSIQNRRRPVARAVKGSTPWIG